MLSIKDHLALVYVTLADGLAQHPALLNWRTSNHATPKFTDAEVLTIALMQRYFQTPTLKRAFLLVKANDPRAFPHAGSYQQWLARLHRLRPLVGQLVTDQAQAGVAGADVYLLDVQPIPVCHPLRHGRVLLLREDGAYFGKTSKGWFFGFKLHLLVTAAGLIVGALLTPGNCDDRDGAEVLCQAVATGSVCLGDLGYRRPELHAALWEEVGVLLMTRADAGAGQQALLCSVRARVETVFSQLWSSFATRVYARSWQGLWSSLLLKMLDHSLCQRGIIPA